MSRPVRRPLLVLAVASVTAGIALALPGRASALDGPGADVGTTRVSGVITPVIADHLGDVIAEAQRRDLQALVVTLDTPGGLVASMRDIVQDLLNAPLPIIVYVSPSGADAGSAGTFITLAAHVAAMAPATTIGAATPVDLEGGAVGDKVVNNAAAYARAVAEARGRDVDFAVDSVREGRSVTSDEAVEIGAVDLLAPDVATLLERLDGRTVTVDGTDVVLATGGADTVALDMSATRRLLQFLADPNLAFLLLSLSTLAILYELANPGVGAGGVTGAVALIMGLYALSVLPVDIAGVALLVVAAVLFAAEVAAPGLGVAAAGGTVALLLSGLFLFPRPTGIGIDLGVLLPTVALTAGGAIALGVVAARTRSMEVHVGSDALVGRTATVRGDTDPRVTLDGTSWRVRPARGDVRIAAGDVVSVVDRDNLDLLVLPTDTTPAVDPTPVPTPKEP